MTLLDLPQTPADDHALLLQQHLNSCGNGRVLSVSQIENHLRALGKEGEALLKQHARFMKGQGNFGAAGYAQLLAAGMLIVVSIQLALGGDDLLNERVVVAPFLLWSAGIALRETVRQWRWRHLSQVSEALFLVQLSGFSAKMLDHLGERFGQGHRPCRWSTDLIKEEVKRRQGPSRPPDFY